MYIVSLCFSVKQMAVSQVAPVLCLTLLYHLCVADYTIDDSYGLGRTFDGIGGLSGGGVSTEVWMGRTLHKPK